MKTSHLSPTAWLSESLEGRIFGNCFWIDTRLLLVKIKCPDPGVDQKPDRGLVSGIKSPPLACTPPPPPHGIYIDRCISSDILLNLQAVYLQHLFSNFQIICSRRKIIYTFYLFGGFENILKWHCRKTFSALVVLQFEGSCYVYVDALKQYHLASFSTCNSTIKTSFR